MQDRYAGDIGDYSKISLLRALFPDPKYKIGLIWYRFPDETHNTDGRHVDYLKKPKYQQCDHYLIEKLSHVVVQQRTIQSLEAANLLPQDTIYFSESVDFYGNCSKQTAQAKKYRKQAREQWLSNALDTIANCNVAVLDPDNGLQTNSVPGIYLKKSGKYAFYSEIAAFFKNKAIVVIYQHLNRSTKHINQIKTRTQELKQKIDFDGAVFAIRFHPYSPRAYFFLVTGNEVDAIRKQLHDYLQSPCGFAWDMYYEETVNGSVCSPVKK